MCHFAFRISRNLTTQDDIQLHVQYNLSWVGTQSMRAKAFVPCFADG
jgi:hypothetical protein